MARIPRILRPAIFLLIFFAIMTGLSFVRPEMASVRLTFAPLADLFALFYDMPAGISYQSGWYTLAAIIVLVAVALWIAKKVTRWVY